MKTPAELREAFLDKYFEAGIDDIYDELIAPALLALEDEANHWHTPNADGPEPGCTACAALTAIERKLGISIYGNDATKK